MCWGRPPPGSGRKPDFGGLGRGGKPVSLAGCPAAAPTASTATYYLHLLPTTLLGTCAIHRGRCVVTPLRLTRDEVLDNVPGILLGSIVPPDPTNSDIDQSSETWSHHCSETKNCFQKKRPMPLARHPGTAGNRPKPPSVGGWVGVENRFLEARVGCWGGFQEGWVEHLL